MENLIGYHCAPALAGIKPANIVSCYKNKGYDVHHEIEKLNAQLSSRGIYLEPLCECNKRVLLMVYRKKVLEKALQKPEVQDFLRTLGYAENADTDTYIEMLKKRLGKEEFPHEIGVFLGYPMHDIYGFMYHKNEGCLLCGEWKVYDRPEEAEKMFKRFSSCRRAVMGKINSGKTLAQVFCAA